MYHVGDLHAKVTSFLIGNPTAVLYLTIPKPSY